MHPGGSEPVVQRVVTSSGIRGLEGGVHVLPRPVGEQLQRQEPRGAAVLAGEAV
uniref:Uncharacterized protein n=1 Tax=Arundo donax TaxID=35708 RepID=A0A0A8Z3B2_ARUDO